MSRISGRTLVLLLELLVAIVACQYLTWVEPVHAEVVWLDDELPDPNEAEPEAIGTDGTPIRLDDELPDPNEAEPEAIGTDGTPIRLGDEPEPESM